MPVSRRAFLLGASSCAAHVALLAAARPLLARRIFAPAAPERILFQEPWGRIEQVGDGLWALISTPLQDRTTLCNGGIIRGSAGVAIVESFASPDGARWLARRARELTGRWPDHVILTHYHGDHTGGITGFRAESPDDRAPHVLLTDDTRTLVRQADARRSDPPSPERNALLDGAVLLDPSAPTDLDLGDRRLRIVPRTGHTRSDVTVELVDPPLVWCGDLVWNAMFPNYVDAVPSLLTRDVRALADLRAATYVPGHGPLADASALDRYTALLDAVEIAARSAYAQGVPAAEAAAAFRLPDALADWVLFSPRYFEVAIGAWHRELQGDVRM